MNYDYNKNIMRRRKKEDLRSKECREDHHTQCFTCQGCGCHKNANIPSTIKQRFPRFKKPKIQHMRPTKWHWIVAYPKGLHLEKHVDIGAFTYINAKYGVSIETEVEIGSHCSIYSHNSIDVKAGAILIKKGAKIGSHCVIDPGVTIGENATIGAFSYVKSNIPKGQTWASVPAKRIK